MFQRTLPAVAVMASLPDLTAGRRALAAAVAGTPRAEEHRQ